MTPEKTAALWEDYRRHTGADPDWFESGGLMAAYVLERAVRYGIRFTEAMDVLSEFLASGDAHRERAEHNMPAPFDGVDATKRVERERHAEAIAAMDAWWRDPARPEWERRMGWEPESKPRREIFGEWVPAGGEPTNLTISVGDATDPLPGGIPTMEFTATGLDSVIRARRERSDLTEAYRQGRWPSKDGVLAMGPEGLESLRADLEPEDHTPFWVHSGPDRHDDGE